MLFRADLLFVAASLAVAIAGTACKARRSTLSQSQSTTLNTNALDSFEQTLKLEILPIDENGTSLTGSGKHFEYNMPVESPYSKYARSSFSTKGKLFFHFDDGNVCYARANNEDNSQDEIAKQCNWNSQVHQCLKDDNFLADCFSPQEVRGASFMEKFYNTRPAGMIFYRLSLKDFETKALKNGFINKAMTQLPILREINDPFIFCQSKYCQAFSRTQTAKRASLPEVAYEALMAWAGKENIYEADVAGVRRLLDSFKNPTLIHVGFGEYFILADVGPESVVTYALPAHNIMGVVLMNNMPKDKVVRNLSYKFGKSFATWIELAQDILSSSGPIE